MRQRAVIGGFSSLMMMTKTGRRRSSSSRRMIEEFSSLMIMTKIGGKRSSRSRRCFWSDEDCCPGAKRLRRSFMPSREVAIPPKHIKEAHIDQFLQFDDDDKDREQKKQQQQKDDRRILKFDDHDKDWREKKQQKQKTFLDSDEYYYPGLKRLRRPFMPSREVAIPPKHIKEAHVAQSLQFDDDDKDWEEKKQQQQKDDRRILKFDDHDKDWREKKQQEQKVFLDGDEDYYPGAKRLRRSFMPSREVAIPPKHIKEAHIDQFHNTEGAEIVTRLCPFSTAAEPTSESKPILLSGIDLIETEKAKQGKRWFDSSSYPSFPLSSRPLPYRCPPKPVDATREQKMAWRMECRQISRLAAKDPVTYPPILREPEDLDTTAAVTSGKDKDITLNIARSTVSITSTQSDGVVLLQCSGMITSIFNERTTILTCAEAVCDNEGRLFHCKVCVYFPDRTSKEGRVLFVDHYYNIALLEIQSDMPSCTALCDASFSSNPKYGHEVFVLSRDKDSSLMVKKGSVTSLEKPWLGRNFYMHLNCDAPKFGTGGPVVDQDENIIGMSFDLGYQNVAVLPTSIIKKCIDMQRKFRSVRQLDVVRRDQLSCQHKVDTGFLVDQVAVGCAAEMCGIRAGDVIVSFAGISQSLLQEFFLELGWEFLERSSASSSNVALELQLYDTLQCCQSCITVPLEFFESCPAGTEG